MRMAKAPSIRAKAAPQGASLVGLPLSGTVRLTLNTSGRLVTNFRNHIALPALSKPWLDNHAPRLWCPAEGPERKRRFAWALNFLADPDDYRHALIWQDEAIAPEIPIFNHPRAVVQTRRDLSALRLSGVPGLVVPRCVRFRGDSLAAFEQAFSDHGFRYPVLVRPCSTQGGLGQLRVDSASDWDAALNSRWFGLPHFMTQYEDFQTAEGLYFKARIVFVGERSFVRHVKASSNWRVHNHAPGRVSDDREFEIVEKLEASPVFRALCAEVASRTRLDLCGLDVGVDPAREHYVLFECNPCMTIFFPPRPDQTQAKTERRARLQAPIERALDVLMRDPTAWAVSRHGVQDLPDVRTALTG